MGTIDALGRSPPTRTEIEPCNSEVRDDGRRERAQLRSGFAMRISRFTDLQRRRRTERRTRKTHSLGCDDRAQAPYQLTTVHGDTPDAHLLTARGKPHTVANRAPIQLELPR